MDITPTTEAVFRMLQSFYEGGNDQQLRAAKSIESRIAKKLEAGDTDRAEAAKYRDRTKTAEIDNVRLRGLLRKLIGYTKHNNNCARPISYRHFGTLVPCDCGLAEASKAALEAGGE